MEKEIAIIIPAYNAHDTIERLLFSILNQSIKDLCRVYLIDDCSEKDYFYLIDKFPWLDMVICRLDENGGPGIARNKGLELVIEDNIPYIVFADADDRFIGESGLEKLLLLIKQTDWGISSFYEESSNKEMVLYDDFDIWLFGKIYKTQIIKKYKICFPKTAQNEDVAFNVWYRTCSEDIKNIELPTYIWSFNANSITRKNCGEYAIYSYNGLSKNLVEVFQKMRQDSNINIKKFQQSIANRVLRMFLGYNSYLHKNLSEEIIQEITQSAKNFYTEIYLPEKQNISMTELVNNWKMISTTPDTPFIFMGWDEFTKKMEA